LTPTLPRVVKYKRIRSVPTSQRYVLLLTKIGKVGYQTQFEADLSNH
jgi:hypothetical protein